MALIDREEAIEELTKVQLSADYCREHDIDNSINLGMMCIVLRNLPSVQPKTGHWIHDGSACYCSECKKSPHKDYNKWDVFSPGVWILSDFCPHCGADMRGEQNE